MMLSKKYLPILSFLILVSIFYIRRLFVENLAVLLQNFQFIFQQEKVPVGAEQLAQAMKNALKVDRESISTTITILKNFKGKEKELELFQDVDKIQKTFEAKYH